MYRNLYNIVESLYFFSHRLDDPHDMMAGPGAMHIQIAAPGIKYEIHSLERIFRIVGPSRGILGMKRC
jgi:hypothetical protein